VADGVRSDEDSGTQHDKPRNGNERGDLGDNREVLPVPRNDSPSDDKAENTRGSDFYQPPVLRPKQPIEITTGAALRYHMIVLHYPKRCIGSYLLEPRL
jgi:hypothetical protein